MKPQRFNIIILAALLIGCNGKTKDKSEGNTESISIHTIQLKTLTGETVDMNEFKNKTVFINCWATWCSPCIKEMPTIAQAQEQLKNKNVVFLFASNEEVGLIEKFKIKRNFLFQYVQLQNLEELNIQALPTTFIFNPDGELIFSEAGYRDWSTPESIGIITTKTHQP
jgi:thiol-disulfide isomerase/thioredoxin